MADFENPSVQDSSTDTSGNGSSSDRVSVGFDLIGPTQTQADMGGGFWGTVPGTGVLYGDSELSRVQVVVQDASKVYLRSSCGFDSVKGIWRDCRDMSSAGVKLDCGGGHCTYTVDHLTGLTPETYDEYVEISIALLADPANPLWVWRRYNPEYKSRQSDKGKNHECNACEGNGSIIEEQNKTLGERIPVIGTPFSLDYRSDRVPGRLAGVAMDINPSFEASLSDLDHVTLTLTLPSGANPPSYLSGNSATINAGLLGAQSWFTIPAVRSESQVANDIEVFKAAINVGYYYSTGIPYTNWVNTIEYANWFSKHQGFGGWTLSAQHFYLPNDGTLYYGYGKRREVKNVEKRALAGYAQCTSSVPNGDEQGYVIPDEDGLTVFVFDEDGNHLETFNALTKAPRYCFEYSDHGGRHVLSRVVHGEISNSSHNATIIDRESEGQVAIESPFGLRTVLTIANDYAVAVKRPGDSSGYALTYRATSGSEEGLLETYTDPKGNTHRFTYDDLGRLASDKAPTLTSTDSGDEAPKQGLTRLAPTGTDYQVSHQTAYGRSQSYAVDWTTSKQRTWTNSFGGADDSLTISSVIDDEGNPNIDEAVTKVTRPTGTKYTLTQAKDKLWAGWNLANRIPSSETFEEGGMTVTKSQEVDYILGLSMAKTKAKAGSSEKKLDPAKLTGITTTSTVNEATTTAQDVYDASEQLLTSQVASPAGRVVTTVSDRFGRPQRVQMSGLPDVVYTYDDYGRVLTISQGSGSTERKTSYTYVSRGTNGAGQVATIVDALGNITSYVYDAYQRVTSTTLTPVDTLQAPVTVFYAYDANGNRTTLRTPRSTDHIFSYNAVDLSETYTAPEPEPSTPRVTTYAYNADKELTLVTYPGASGSMQITRDTKLARTTRLVASGNGYTNTYDYAYVKNQGLLASLTGPDADLSFEYLPQSSLVNVATTRFADHRDVRVVYEYASQEGGLRLVATAMEGASGTEARYAYDKDGLLTQAGELEITRDAALGRITKTELGRVKEEARTFSAFGELAGQRYKANGDDLYSVDYTYDSLGRIVTQTERVQGTSRARAYTYDGLGRLQTVSEDGVSRTYAYDANGNRTSTNGVPANYDTQDRLTNFGGNAYTYTDRGSLLAKVSAGGTTSYKYDVVGNLREVDLPSHHILTYEIDAQNRRVGKKLDGALQWRLVYEDGLRPAVQLDSSGNVSARFVYGTKVNVPEYMVKDGEEYRLITDHLGSVRLVVNASTGEIVQRMNYDEWGNVTSDTNPGFQPFGFAGGLYDNDTKLTRFGARDYDAESGTWTAKDPILFGGGQVSLYAYVNGDPVNRVDVSGLWSFPWSNEPGMPFDLPFGPTREENAFRNHSNICPEREPQPQCDQDIEYDKNRVGMYDKGFFDTGLLGGKWRWSDGSECKYDSYSNFVPSEGTYNISPYQGGLLEDIGVTIGHTWNDFVAHYWYGGNDGYVTPDPTKTY